MKRLLTLRYKFNEDHTYIDPLQVKNESESAHKIMNRSVSGMLHLIIYPLRKMVKDLIDTFKPYKGEYQVKRDYMQAWTGLKKLTNAAGLVLYPFVVVYIGFLTIFRPIVMMPTFLRVLILFPLIVITNLLRGATQFITSPLALLRIPFRKLITAFTGVPTVENNPGIQALVKEGVKAHASQQSTRLIDHVLTEKVKKSIEQGQKTNIPSIAESFGTNRTYSYREFLVAKTHTSKIDVSIESTQTYVNEDSMNSRVQALSSTLL